jgi:hypothetical protein
MERSFARVAGAGYTARLEHDEDSARAWARLDGEHTRVAAKALLDRARKSFIAEETSHLGADPHAARRIEPVRRLDLEDPPHGCHERAHQADVRKTSATLRQCAPFRMRAPARRAESRVAIARLRGGAADGARNASYTARRAAL